MENTYSPNLNLRSSASVRCHNYFSTVDLAYCGTASAEDHLYNLRACIVHVMQRSHNITKKDVGRKRVWWHWKGAAPNHEDAHFFSVYEAQCCMEKFLRELSGDAGYPLSQRDFFSDFLSFLLYGERVEDGRIFLACLITNSHFVIRGKNRGTRYSHSDVGDRVRKTFRTLEGYLAVRHAARMSGFCLPIEPEEMFLEYNFARLWSPQSRHFVGRTGVWILKSILSEVFDWRDGDPPQKVQVGFRRGQGRVPYIYMYSNHVAYSLHGIFTDKLIVVAKTKRRLRSGGGVLRHFFRIHEKMPSNPSAFSSWLEGLILLHQLGGGASGLRAITRATAPESPHDALFWFRPGGVIAGVEKIV